ncbi:Linoleate 10R-lipoxygenase [Leucoagaricus sp. SymC.cos]|nr:Linoleate 10R-lipoxygenase [Leucoagaricus sp. SymC.cos]
MSIFNSLARSFARNIDYANASHAPLDTDGARPRTHNAETKVTHLLEVLSKPVLTLGDLRAFDDLIRHGDELDDRKMLLEVMLVKMAQLKDNSISLKMQQVVIGLLFKDLPHPPNGFLSPLDISTTTHVVSTLGTLSPPKMPKHIHYAYRAADGSNYNPLIPGIGKAGSPYARSVPSTNLTPRTTLPDPNLVFDTLLKRDEFKPHPDGISSLFFAFADLVIHSIFNTDPQDQRINKASSYLDLSVLYGSSEEEVEIVRANDGTGKLKPDCFADVRLLMMPPASCALLILLNRNHNYIAQKLLEINEWGYFKDPSTIDDSEQKKMQDDEIFHRTRLINCGYFMHIILGDYVGAILGLVRDGSDWRLDPLMNMREMNHEVSVRGEGNVCSLEFNLLYRWHSTLSQNNVKWLSDQYPDVFKTRADGTVSPQDFLTKARDLKMKMYALPPTEWTFDGKERDKRTGMFKDADLAEILQNATQDVAGAFKARGIPESMKVIEVLGIMQSRKWGTCSLNEFRKFIGLKPYETFSEWNPDSKIAKAAESLYKDINRLELHVGLQAEETKVPGPGAGLCPGFTISRAILSDAVCLTRGDRFLTADFTPFNLTSWGWNDCQYDKEDGSYGGLLTKLLFRTLPDHYPAGSVLAHFPFTIPEKMHATLTARADGSVHKYRWPVGLDLPDGAVPLPATIKDVNWKVIKDLGSVKKVLTTDASKFASTVPTRQQSIFDLVVTGKKEKKSSIFSDIENKHAPVIRTIVGIDKWPDYFKDKTELLIKQNSFTQVGSENSYVDIVKDVIDLLPVHMICEDITGLPLKWQGNPRGSLYEQETCDKFADIGRYIYMNFSPVDDYKLRERSQKYTREFIELIKDRLENAETGPFAVLSESFMEWATSSKKSESVKFMRKLRGNIGTSFSSQKLAMNLFNATIPTAALFSKAIARVIDYFLDDANVQARKGLVDIYQSKESDSSAKIMGYIREVLRLNPIFSGVYRTVSHPVPDLQLASINDLVLLDIVSANNSLGTAPDYTRPAGEAILTPYEDGLLTPQFFDAVAPVIVGTILSQKGLKRAVGESGKLTKFDENWHGTDREQYVNISGLVTPWPDAMIVEFDSTAK